MARSTPPNRNQRRQPTQAPSTRPASNSNSRPAQPPPPRQNSDSSRRGASPPPNNASPSPQTNERGHRAPQSERVSTPPPASAPSSTPTERMVQLPPDVASSIAERSTIIQNQTIASTKGVQRPFGIPDYLTINNFYYYRFKVLTLDGQQSDFSEEIRVSTFVPLAGVTSLRAVVVNPKVSPFTVKLTWGFESGKFRPDNFLIERKFDNAIDSFIPIAREYMKGEYFDRQVEPGYNYIYRVRSEDNLNRKTPFVEVRIFA